MTTYTSISNTSFSIKFETENFDRAEKTHSNRVKHCGLEWSLYINRTEESKLLAYLHCYGNNSNAWSVNITNTTKLWRNDGTYSSGVFTEEFNCEQKNCKYATLGFISNVVDQFAHDGKITIECCVDIESISGNHPERKHNFHDNESKLTDVTLLVEGRPLYANKATLAFFSPVFHAMFFSDFKEKNENVVELKDVKFDDFEEFLQLLHHCSVEINAENVDSLLILADRYNTPMVTSQCESFLVLTKRVKIHEKLGYAEKYQLIGLQTKCVSSIETLPLYEAACVEVEKRDKTTMVGLIHKAIAMMKKMTTTTTTAPA